MRHRGARSRLKTLAGHAGPFRMAAYRILRWLVPSPFSRTSHPKASASSDKITALDGLRGVACLIVLHEHWTCAVDDPWRTHALNDLATGVMWQPLVILLWGGEAMVNLFFVISGYVLAHRPMRMLYSSGQPKMLETIASSIFRRGFRLLLPTMAVILLIAALTQMRAFEPARRVFDQLNAAQAEVSEQSKNGRKGPLTTLVREALPPLAGSFLAQALDAIHQCFVLVKASAEGKWLQADVLTYDAHLWTIPVEFKSSMNIYLLAIGTSTFTSGWRLLVHITVLLYCILEDYTRTGLFIGGMLVAEIDIVQKHFDHVGNPRNVGPLLGLPSLPPMPPSASRFFRRFDATAVGWGLGFLLGLLLLSVPYIEPVTASPYIYLAALFPDVVTDKNRVIRLIGAVLTTWSCVRCSLVAPVFNCRIAQYLGKVSFALYLTHGLMIRSLGYVVIGTLRTYSAAYVREETSLSQFVAIWACGYVVMLPLLLWVADLYWRSIDVPSVRLARWLEWRFRRPQKSDL